MDEAETEDVGSVLLICYVELGYGVPAGTRDSGGFVKEGHSGPPPTRVPPPQKTYGVPSLVGPNIFHRVGVVHSEIVTSWKRPTRFLYSVFLLLISKLRTTLGRNLYHPSGPRSFTSAGNHRPLPLLFV